MSNYVDPLETLRGMGAGLDLGGLIGAWCPSPADDDDSVISHKCLDFSGLLPPDLSNEEGILTASIPSGTVGRESNLEQCSTTRASSERSLCLLHTQNQGGGHQPVPQPGDRQAQSPLPGSPLEVRVEACLGAHTPM